jgi:hypothetical protein
MKRHLTAVFLFISFISPLRAVDIREGTFAGADHFIVETKSATYYLDKQGGGLSRMIDIYGNDWISFKKEPSDSYPESAASSFRGVPNLVYGSLDSGVGHPGYQKCYSFKVNDQSILTISKSGEWQWRWVFYEHYVSITIEKVDPGARYWFLYEGVIAGEFNPAQQYWGTNLGGPRTEMNDYYKGDKIFANWHYIYFGDKRVKQVLFVAMQKPDRQIDTLGFLGNSAEGIASDDGMVVFGFGRQADDNPQLTDPHNTFYLGFLKRKVKTRNGHENLEKEILSIIR